MTQEGEKAFLAHRVLIPVVHVSNTDLQCVFVVLGVQHCRHCGKRDAGFDLRGHQRAGQLGTEESHV